MSRDRPDVPEILKTIDEFVAQLADGMEGRERYEALCARYLLAVAQRELAGGVGMDSAEQQSLEAFLGESGPLDALYERLAVSIRAGRCDARWEGVFDLVLAHVINKVAVSRPEQLESSHRASAPPAPGSQLGGLPLGRD